MFDRNPGLFLVGVLWVSSFCLIQTVHVVAFQTPAIVSTSHHHHHHQYHQYQQQLQGSRIISTSRSVSNDPNTATEKDVEDEIDDDNDNDNDDDPSVIPYLNRTLAWTKRYRRLVPYASARRTAMRLGLRSKEEWEDIREFGKAFHGAHSVNRPDIMYAKEWISWEEFLGVMRPYDDAKEVVATRLQQQHKQQQVNSMEEYRSWVSEHVKEAEDLRIPAKPEIYYKDKGWKGWGDFLGCDDDSDDDGQQ